MAIFNSYVKLPEGISSGWKLLELPSGYDYCNIAMERSTHAIKFGKASISIRAMA